MLVSGRVLPVRLKLVPTFGPERGSAQGVHRRLSETLRLTFAGSFAAGGSLVQPGMDANLRI